MNALLVLAALALSAAPQSPALRRCGWIDNPTNGNWWLTDRDGSWMIREQGSYEAPGMEQMENMSAWQWVRTNGHYGYGCGCLHVSVDRSGERITRITRARSLPLRQCRADPRLPRR